MNKFSTCLLTLALSTATQLAADPKLEHVIVTARGTGSGAATDTSLLSLPLDPGAAPVPFDNLADLLHTQPGLAHTGQGGLLQTVSIRGISGQRVANFYGDIPIQSERRAGTSSSFIDPLMLGSAEVIRGPASVYYGSGAVGGVVQLQPARAPTAEAQLQWGSEGNANLLYLGYGNEDAAVAISRRSANDSKAPDGTPLHTRFEQVNAQFLWDFKLAGRDIALNTLVSEARDIGKSNAQYPAQRRTDYPLERHWLAQASSDLGTGGQASAWYHQQELETRVERPQSRVNDLENSARDWGLRVGFDGGGNTLQLRMGAEYFGRRNVQSEETETPAGEAPLPAVHTLNADQDSFDLHLDALHQFDQAELAAGLRWSFLSQQARGFSAEHEQAPSLFVRGSWFASTALEFSLEVASGVRFPSLGERFFSGTTGRGQVLGSPDLDAEQTLSADLGLRWHSGRSALEAHVYGMRVDDYIERFDLNPGLRSFSNVSRGEIRGAEAAWRFKLGELLALQAGAHYLEGEDKSGTTLADIAAPRINLGLEYLFSDWTATLNFEHRFEQSGVAPSEQPIDRATLLSASMGRSWPQGWRISLWGRNLLDASYRVSGDSIAPLGAERGLGVSLSWRNPG